MKCKVIQPFSRMTPKNGFETFTTGDVVDISDEAEAKRMQEAGIVKMGTGKGGVETMEAQVPDVEKAVKPGKAG